MARFKKLPINAHEGKIVYGDYIVDGIVLLAIQEIPYVELYSTSQNSKMTSNAIKVGFEKDGVHVDVAVKIHFSQSVADTSFKIQESIRHNVEAMTEYHVASVNVSINGIIFDEILPEEKPSQSDTQKGDL
jgi:uncharacterized alkaline shock family protein YloU